MAKIDIDTLVDLAFSVEEGDPIDWGVFRQGREEALRLIATSIVEQFDKNLSSDAERLIVLATITKLVVENMVLHTKIMEYQKKNEM
jgi:hypothetical protein